MELFLLTDRSMRINASVVMLLLELDLLWQQLGILLARPAGARVI